MTEQEFRELLEFLEATPEIVRQMTFSMPEQDMKWKPSDDEFSALEQVCHLRDIEREGYAVRIERLLSEDQPLLTDVNGSRLASERDYNNQHLAAALRDFTLARIENINILRTLSSDRLETSGVLEGLGEITLAGLLLLMHQHDQAHREELTQLLKRSLHRVAAESGSSKSDSSVR